MHSAVAHGDPKKKSISLYLKYTFTHVTGCHSCKGGTGGLEYWYCSVPFSYISLVTNSMLQLT